VNIIDSMKDSDFFSRWFHGASWDPWIVFLVALFGLPMTQKQANIYRKLTSRSKRSKEPVQEATVIVGRRGGKSLIAALVCVFLACFRDYSAFLSPGEVATVMLIAADRRQARVVMRYIVGFLEYVPMLKEMITRRTRDTIELSNRVVIEIHTCSFRSTRGYALAAVICDEIAFWRSEESANPDVEILNAIRPGMITIPGSLLLCISSPYARRGALWEAYRKHYGKDGDPVLVWQAATRDMNPTVDAALIAKAYQEDESAASAEYGAQFRRDIESFVSREAVEACVTPSRQVLPPIEGLEYVGFVDPSGGSSDSMTLAISHSKNDRAILDLALEVKSPFSPESVTKQFSAVLKSYRIERVTGDRYAGEWPRERFSEHGIEYEPSEMTKNEIYSAFLPLLNSGRVELLDNSKLISQLSSLERRTARGGRDSIDHAPNGHDDVINAVAGALVLSAVEAPKPFALSLSAGSGTRDIPAAEDIFRLSLTQQNRGW
jgi:hypothetical protein